MSFQSVDDIIQHYTKEDKPVITNPNHNLDKLPDFKDLARTRRYKNSHRMTLVDARENPHERNIPEGFCSTCKGFTTNYNSRGECSDCGTQVTADISEGETE